MRISNVAIPQWKNTCITSCGKTLVLLKIPHKLPNITLHYSIVLTVWCKKWMNSTCQQDIYLNEICLKPQSLPYLIFFSIHSPHLLGETIHGNLKGYMVIWLHSQFDELYQSLSIHPHSYTPTLLSPPSHVHRRQTDQNLVNQINYWSHCCTSLWHCWSYCDLRIKNNFHMESRII